MLTFLQVTAVSAYFSFWHISDSVVIVFLQCLVHQTEAVAVPHPLDQPLDLEDQIQQFQCLTFLKPHHCQPHQPTLSLPKYHLNNLPTTTQNKQWKSCSRSQFLSCPISWYDYRYKRQKQKKFITLQYIKHSERNYRKCTKLLSIHLSVTSMLMGVLSDSRILQCQSSKINRINEQFKLSITLTLRWLMSYIYGAPILDVSRSHTTTQHSR